ncbi:TolC family outer membrane protein [Pseudoalteromonas sp.]|uniref:TolC family outer membrane protein n=1 Tax=Pseudoalteromonas sp. TaxID=53249 RepID=UPI002619667A|nr:TolC family outer membrane protein [Pseudoalteromonas sp.]MCP4588747.1 TolC family outer membrane protein [Pseudoalteromonas sp.]
MKTWFKCLMFALPASTLSAGELQSLYEKVLNSDPRLKISLQETIVSDARLDQTTARLLPQVSFTSNWTENSRETLNLGSKDSYKGEKYSLTVRQDVFNLSKWHDRKRYQYLSEESQERLRDSEVLVTSDLVDRYVDALAAQDDLELTIAEKNATKKQLELLKSRYKKQLAVLTDVLEVEARYDGIRADEIAARAQVEIAFESLSELIGEPVIGPFYGLNEDIELQAGLGSLDSWTQRALKDNPSLRALLSNMQAAEAAIRQAKSDHLPTVDISLSAQKSDIGFENSQTSRTQTYVASLNLMVPIYQGGSVTARKKEQRALYAIAQQEYDEARRGVLRSVRASFLNTQASFSRIDAASKAVESAIKSYEAQEKGLKYGTVTVVDVLDALREQYRFRRDFRQAQYDFIINWVQLLSNSGGLSADHIALIDSWQSPVEQLAIQ